TLLTVLVIPAIYVVLRDADQVLRSEKSSRPIFQSSGTLDAPATPLCLLDNIAVCYRLRVPDLIRAG
ncbi:MAG: hypothetical protein ABSF41_16515, partial [Pseudolabrys sp.]